MEEANPNYKEMIFVGKIIHYGLAVVLVIFGVCVFYINQTDPVGEINSINEILIYIPAISLLSTFPISSIVFKNQIKQGITEPMPLNRKISVFQTAHLIRMSLFEFSGLISVVVSFITANNYSLVILFIVLLMFIFLTPSAARIGIDLSLNRDEREFLEN
jgi:hypothetical protein